MKKTIIAVLIFCGVILADSTYVELHHIFYRSSQDSTMRFMITANDSSDLNRAFTILANRGVDLDSVWVLYQGFTFVNDSCGIVFRNYSDMAFEYDTLTTEWFDHEWWDAVFNGVDHIYKPVEGF